jgi:hypothetical protein
MLVELHALGGPDKEIRFRVEIDGKECGELQTGREEFTRLADLIFGRNYKLIQNGNDIKNNDRGN